MLQIFTHVHFLLQQCRSPLQSKYFLSTLYERCKKETTSDPTFRLGTRRIRDLLKCFICVPLRQFENNILVLKLSEVRQGQTGRSSQKEKETIAIEPVARIISRVPQTEGQTHKPTSKNTLYCPPTRKKFAL